MLQKGGIPFRGLGLGVLVCAPALTQALGSTTASIGLQTTKYTVADHSLTKESVEYEANTNYDPCTCNLTSRTCDAFCCCDTECSFVTSLFPQLIFFPPSVGCQIPVG